MYSEKCKMTCIDRNAMMCTEGTTEVEALKKALAEAEGKAVKEQAARKKLKARVNEVQQELQDAVKKCKTLERDASAQETELAKAHQSVETAQIEARASSRRSRRPGRSRQVRHSVCKARM